MRNVLIRYQAREYTSQYVKDMAEGDFLCQEVFQSVEWIQLDRGILSEEDAICSICKRLPQHLQHYVATLIEHWHTYIPPYPEMEKLVKELKQHGYKIYLLSNTSLRFHKFRVNIPALQYFDGEFISADYKMLKPEQIIFQTFLKQFDLRAEECYFIDDFNVNIEAAMFAGMKGFIYRGSIEVLRTAMQKEGIAV